MHRAAAGLGVEAHPVVLGPDVDVGEAFEVGFAVEFRVRVAQKQAGMLGKGFRAIISPGCPVSRIEAPVSGSTTTSMPRAWTCISPIRRGPVGSTAMSEAAVSAPPVELERWTRGGKCV